MEIKNRKKNKINWRSGTGEIIGFAVVIPFIVLVVCAIVSIASITLTEQKLLYTAYCAGRAAVVSKTESLARQRADKVVQATYPGAGSANLGVGGSMSRSQVSQATGNGGAYWTMQLLAHSADGDKSDWQKGNVVKISVYKDVRVFLPFTSGVRGQSIAMMVENSDNPNVNLSNYQ